MRRGPPIATIWRARASPVLARMAMAVALLAWAVPAWVSSQDLQFIYPIPEIEERLRDRPFTVLSWRGTRMEEDRTQYVLLEYDDESVMAVKWANAPPSDVGYEWRDIQVRRLPQQTVDRLRALTQDDFQDALGVIAEFENRDGELFMVTPGENLAPRRGVRQEDGRVQFGLTGGEIRDIEVRRIRLLQMVDQGVIDVF